MQRTPGQMPVDSHSTRLRDPDHPDHYRSSRSQKFKGVSLVETAGHGGGAGDMLRREVGPLSALCPQSSPKICTDSESPRAENGT